MDHHSLAFQLFLFLIFYGTFEWIRHEQSKCTSVTQGQQKQTSDLTHTVEVVDETIAQTDDSIVTSSTSTDIQVHLETEPETEPALHTPELVSVVVHQVEKSAAAAVELEATELNAIAPIEPVSAEASTPTLPASTTDPAVPSNALESSSDTLFSTSVSITAELPLSTQPECPINTLFTFPLDTPEVASSIEPIEITGEEPVGTTEAAPPPQLASTPPSSKKRPSRQARKAQPKKTKVPTAA